MGKRGRVNNKKIKENYTLRLREMGRRSYKKDERRKEKQSDEERKSKRRNTWNIEAKREQGIGGDEKEHRKENKNREKLE